MIIFSLLCQFIFLNSWNNYYDGSYLEPDNKFGFGFLNALSKTIFNLNFKNKTYIYSNLNNYVKVTIQAHIAIINYYFILK